MATDAEIDKVREIAQLSSFTEAASLIAGLASASWTRVAVAITEWDTIHRKHINFRGKGVDVNYERYRKQIINEMRTVLGLVPLAVENSLPSGVARNTPRW